MHYFDGILAFISKLIYRQSKLIQKDYFIITSGVSRQSRHQESCLRSCFYSFLSRSKKMKTPWQVATAAEAFAAAQFVRFGWDISVQYGANQPEYDLVAVDGDRMMKVSVKGSRDGKWGLTQSYIKNADYHSAADRWLAKHSNKTVFCLVQFKGVSLDSLPRMYLATPREIADSLKDSAAGRGSSILCEHHKWTARAKAAGTVDVIPDSWKFTQERLDEITERIEQACPTADLPVWHRKEKQ